MRVPAGESRSGVRATRMGNDMAERTKGQAFAWPSLFKLVAC